MNNLSTAITSIAGMWIRYEARSSICKYSKIVWLLNNYLAALVFTFFPSLSQV